MKQSHLATAAFWIGLLTLFGWQASADQVLRPPLPIPPPPSAPRPPASTVALMPPTARLLRSAPTPIPPQPPIPPPTPVTMPILPRVMLPPVEYDHEYAGKLTVLKEDNYVFIRHVCRDTPNAIACSYRTYDSVSGETLSCLIVLGPVAHNDARVMQHELGHCNGWSNNHERARYGD